MPRKDEMWGWRVRGVPQGMTPRSSIPTPRATHQRLRGRYQTAAKLDHYADLLRCKPGAFRGALALAQDRERGAWPAYFDELWGLIAARYGASAAAAQMVDVLLLVREHGLAATTAAAAQLHQRRCLRQRRRCLACQESGPSAIATACGP